MPSAPSPAEVIALVANITAAKDALFRSRPGGSNATPGSTSLLLATESQPGKSPVVSPQSGYLLLPESEITASIVLTDLSGLSQRQSPVPPPRNSLFCATGSGSGIGGGAAAGGGSATALTSQELALYNASAKLCETLGGVDYRSVAITANKALDAVLRMVRAEFDLAAKADLTPTSLVVRQALTFHGLLDEARRLLAASGYPVPPAAPVPPITSHPFSTSTAHMLALHSSNASSASGGGGGQQRLSVNPGQPRVRNVSIDLPDNTVAGTANNATPRRQSSNINASSKAAHEPAASEAYDLRLMHSNFADAAGGTGGGGGHGSSDGGKHTRDLEDEITMLRSKVERLQSEKKTLLSLNEKNQALVAQLKQKLGMDLDNIQSLQSQMEREIKLLAVQTGNGSVVAAAGSGKRVAQADAILSKIPIAANPPRDAEPEPQHHCGLGTPPNGRTTAATSSAASPVPQPQTPSPPHSHPPSIRFERIESLYHDVYRGKGMDMLWNTLHCVFKSEFDTPHNQQQVQQQQASQQAAASSIPAVAPAAAAATPAPAGEDGLSMPVQVEGAGDPGHLLAYNLFKTQFYDHVVGKLATYPTFLESLVQITPLRSDYIANCLKTRVKPNSGVVKLLSTITSDRDATELNLSNNYLGDGGLAPLIPIIIRLYRLHSLLLSDVGIKNSGAQQLAHALINHPSLVRLDVSKNAISRTGGKELLTLASTLSSLRSIDISGTSIDPALQERIMTRVSLNAAAPPPGVASPSPRKQQPQQQ